MSVTGMQFRADQLKVVVFDVDGPLYRQSPLRRAMLVRLLKFASVRPLEGVRTFRMLQAYRNAQEGLRGFADGDLAAAQLRLACERTNSTPAVMAACIERWMEQEPLPRLPACRYPGLIDLLRQCKARGLRLAALSDYPAEAKLRALGIADLFELILCAQNPAIGVFKPHPRGLEVA